MLGAVLEQGRTPVRVDIEAQGLRTVRARMAPAPVPIWGQAQPLAWGQAPPEVLDGLLH